jgi:hypothetical protein
LVRRAVLTFLLIGAALLGASSASAETTTFGSLAPDSNAANAGCGGCIYFQNSVSSGPSYVVPYDGTITEFDMHIGKKPTSSEHVQPFVVRAIGGGKFQLVGNLARKSLTSSPAHSIAKLPANLAVQAGDEIGVNYNTSSVAGSWGPPSGTSADRMYFWTGGFLAGATATPDPNQLTTPARLNLQAVLSFTPPPAPDTTKPVISGLKTKYGKFRVSTRGAIIAKTSPKGTTFSYLCSETSTVTYTVSVLKTSSKSKKKTLKTVHSFTRNATAGSNKISFSGRYRDSKGHRRSLDPGSYKLTVTPVDPLGNVGDPQTVSFTIAH